MYPPKRDLNSQRNKYGPSPINRNQIASPPNSASRDITKINKILQNAKNYHKEREKPKEAKRDYLMEGLTSAQKQSKVYSQSKIQTKEKIKSEEGQMQKDLNFGVGQKRFQREKREQLNTINSQNELKDKKNTDKNFKEKPVQFYDREDEKMRQRAPINIQIGFSKSSPKYYDQEQKEIKSLTQIRSDSEIIQKKEPVQKPVQQIISKKKIGENSKLGTAKNQQEKKDSYLYNRSNIDQSKIATRQNQNTITSMKILLDQNQHQLLEMRKKFYKAEEQKNFLEQKIKQLETQSKQYKHKSEDYLKKLGNAQSKLAQKQKHIQNLTTYISKLQDTRHGNLVQLQKKINDMNEEMLDKINQNRYLTAKITNLDHKISNKDIQLQKYKEIHKQNEHIVEKIKFQYDQHINKLEKELTQLKKQIKKKSFKENSLEQISANIQKQLEKQYERKLEEVKDKTLQKQNNYESQIRQRDVLINHLKNKNNTNSDMEDFRLQVFEQQLSKIQQQKIETIEKYQEILKNREQIICQMKDQLKSYKENREKENKNIQHSDSEFENILREYVEKINNLRTEAAEKNSQNMNLLAQISIIAAEKNNLQSNLKILSAQLEHSKMKKLEDYSTAQKITENEIKTLKKKLQVMSSQLEQKKKQIKAKDNFVQSYLLSITKEDQVVGIMNRMQQMFTE